MDFSEQDADVFEDFEADEEEEAGAERADAAEEDGGGSGDSSASSSSSSSSSSSASDSSSRSSSDGEEEDGNSAPVRVRTAGVEREYAEEQEEEEDEDRDLFGPENEAYVKTLSRSPYPVPILPPLQNNQNRGNFGRGRWQSGYNARGPPLLPRPGTHSQRQNYGFGSKFAHANGRDSEQFVSEMRLTKSEETLSRKIIQIQEPSEIACYSRVEGGEVFFDDRSLRLFKRTVCEDVGADLNRGFEAFVEKRDLGSQGFGDLLSCVRNKNIPLQNIHFVTFRNNLNKILATAYIKNEPWKMGVHKRCGVVYLDVHKLPERPQNKLDSRRKIDHKINGIIRSNVKGGASRQVSCNLELYRCYWGYAFENLATENSTEIDGKGIDANVEFCSVIKTKLGAHRIIMGAEMDCCDSTDDGRRFYVELKTSRELDYRTEERYEREKLLKFWIQSFLAGVPYIVVGFRDDAGILVGTERLRTKDVTQRVKMKNYWQGGVCLAFADEVLCWLYGTVKENEDYILQFMPPFHRLELLRADSCPEAITYHIEQT